LFPPCIFSLVVVFLARFVYWPTPGWYVPPPRTGSPACTWFSVPVFGGFFWFGLFFGGFCLGDGVKNPPPPPPHITQFLLVIVFCLFGPLWKPQKNLWAPGFPPPPLLFPFCRRTNKPPNPYVFFLLRLSKGGNRGSFWGGGPFPDFFFFFVYWFYYRCFWEPCGGPPPPTTFFSLVSGVDFPGFPPVCLFFFRRVYCFFECTGPHISVTTPPLPDHVFSWCFSHPNVLGFTHRVGWC